MSLFKAVDELGRASSTQRQGARFLELRLILTLGGLEGCGRHSIGKREPVRANLVTLDGLVNRFLKRALSEREGTADC